MVNHQADFGNLLVVNHASCLCAQFAIHRHALMWVAKCHGASSLQKHGSFILCLGAWQFHQRMLIHGCSEPLTEVHCPLIYAFGSSAG